jgi:SAM-dependent methyltransferase
MTTNESLTYSKYATYNSWAQDKVEEGIKFRIGDYDEQASVWHSIFFGFMPDKEILPEVDGKVRVLDVGCNTGYNTRTLRDLYGYAVGIDPNPRLIKHAKYNIDTCHCMAAEEMSFDDESFSFVVAKDVLEHCKDPDKALAEIYRVLADDGALLAMIPLDGEMFGYDDVIKLPAHSYGNVSHTWKATERSVYVRLFNLGFTDIQVQIVSHSQTFGQERPYGDRVLSVYATKKKGIVKVPTHLLMDSSYWSAFITFKCTSNCWYCIQRVCKDAFIETRSRTEKAKLTGEQWVEYYNSLQKWNSQRLGIIGGEPTIHPDFFEIVNGIKGYYKTVTTNLHTPEIAKFGDMIEDKDNLRINCSYHPELMSVDDFANKIHMLRDQGFTLDQIAMVDTPMVDFRKYHTEFLGRGLAITPQTFLGVLNGSLYPEPESTVITDHGETGINNYGLYNQGFGMRNKEDVVCSSGRFLIAPDGGIHRCHYHLYSGRDPQGSVLTKEFPIDQDYRLCKDFGFCNPCDFPHVKFKPVMANLKEVLLVIMKGNEEDANSVGTVLQHMFNSSEKFQALFNEVFNAMYASRDPWWTLYNNTELHDKINEYICEGGIVDNSNVEYLAALEYVLFQKLESGVNLYKILTDESIVKYLAALSAIHSEVLQKQPFIAEFFGEDGALISSMVAKMLSTFGTQTAYEDLYIAPKRKNEDEEA